MPPSTTSQRSSTGKPPYGRPYPLLSVAKAAHALQFAFKEWHDSEVSQRQALQSSGGQEPAVGNTQSTADQEMVVDDEDEEVILQWGVNEGDGRPTKTFSTAWISGANDPLASPIATLAAENDDGYATSEVTINDTEPSSKQAEAEPKRLLDPTEFPRSFDFDKATFKNRFAAVEDFDLQSISPSRCVASANAISVFAKRATATPFVFHFDSNLPLPIPEFISPTNFTAEETNLRLATRPLFVIPAFDLNRAGSDTDTTLKLGLATLSKGRSKEYISGILDIFPSLRYRLAKTRKYILGKTGSDASDETFGPEAAFLFKALSFETYADLLAFQVNQLLISVGAVDFEDERQLNALARAGFIDLGKVAAIRKKFPTQPVVAFRPAGVLSSVAAARKCDSGLVLTSDFDATTFGIRLSPYLAYSTPSLSTPPSLELLTVLLITPSFVQQPSSDIIRFITRNVAFTPYVDLVHHAFDSVDPITRHYLTFYPSPSFAEAMRAGSFALDRTVLREPKSGKAPAIKQRWTFTSVNIHIKNSPAYQSLRKCRGELRILKEKIGGRWATERGGGDPFFGEWDFQPIYQCN